MVLAEEDTQVGELSLSTLAVSTSFSCFTPRRHYWGHLNMKDLQRMYLMLVNGILKNGLPIANVVTRISARLKRKNFRKASLEVRMAISWGQGWGVLF